MLRFAGSENPLNDFPVEKLHPGQPFHLRSYFGQYAHRVFNFVEKSQPTDIEGLHKNDHYSREFAQYLRTFVLPYFPLISVLTISACRLQTNSLTNNEIEQYFGHLKTNLYKNRKNQKLSRFIRRQAAVTKGTTLDDHDFNFLFTGVYNNLLQEFIPCKNAKQMKVGVGEPSTDKKSSQKPSQKSQGEAVGVTTLSGAPAEPLYTG